jgi:hypothetical protein
MVSPAAGIVNGYDRLGGVLVKRTQIGEGVKLAPERDDAAKQPLATVAVRQVAGGLPARDSGPERILTMLATGVQQPMTCTGCARCSSRGWWREGRDGVRKAPASLDSPLALRLMASAAG